MHFEDWKEWMKKNDLDSQLLWLIGSYDRYLRENRDKWESLRNTSRVSDNYKEAVDYNNREADAQKERYEWLLQYISENYIYAPYKQYKCKDCKHCKIKTLESVLPESKNGTIRGVGHCDFDIAKFELSRAACSNFIPREEDNKEDERRN